MGGIHGLKSMADGRIYDSKSRYRANLRARGLVEVGNEQNRPDQRRPFSANTEPESTEIIADIRQATEQLSSMSVTERANYVGAIERGEV